MSGGGTGRGPAEVIVFVVPFILPGSEPAIPWLEVITLVALLIPFLGWVVGVVLLWLSPSWTTREKRIGTLLALGVGALALAALSSQVEWISPPRDPAHRCRSAWPV
jgi:hypothetical protein